MGEILNITLPHTSPLENSKCINSSEATFDAATVQSLQIQVFWILHSTA